MPSNRSLNAMNRAHRTLLTLTRGKVGWHLYGMPMLELTTTGRTSGQKRDTMLSSPLQLADTIVIVASRGGDDFHPGWYLNLIKHPDVEVVFQGGPRQSMRARTASPAERAELWPRVTHDHPNYAGYQRKTSREIPLVLLEPVRTSH